MADALEAWKNEEKEEVEANVDVEGTDKDPNEVFNMEIIIST